VRGVERLRAVRSERILAADLERETQPLDHPLYVVALRVESVVHDRLGGWVRRCKSYRAAAGRRQQARRHPHAMGFRILRALVDDLQRHEVELGVGCWRVWADPGEPSRLGEVRREWAGLRGFVLLQRRGL